MFMQLKPRKPKPEPKWRIGTAMLGSCKVFYVYRLRDPAIPDTEDNRECDPFGYMTMYRKAVERLFALSDHDERLTGEKKPPRTSRSGRESNPHTVYHTIHDNAWRI